LISSVSHDVCCMVRIELPCLNGVVSGVTQVAIVKRPEKSKNTSFSLIP